MEYNIVCVIQAYSSKERIINVESFEKKNVDSDIL